MNVIYQTAEDGLADTIKPRLESAGADCTRVLVIDEGKRELTLCDARLEEAIRRTGAKLIVLDPLQAYLQYQNHIGKFTYRIGVKSTWRTQSYQDLTYNNIRVCLSFQHQHFVLRMLPL